MTSTAASASATRRCTTAAPNLTAYAVCGDSGKIRVAVIEKDATTAAPVSIAIRFAAGRTGATASVVHLTGKSLASAQGVQIQGVSVDRTGLLPFRPADKVGVHDGALGLPIASGSAERITVGG